MAPVHARARSAGAGGRSSPVAPGPGQGAGRVQGGGHVHQRQGWCARSCSAKGWIDVSEWYHAAEQAHREALANPVKAEPSIVDSAVGGGSRRSPNRRTRQARVGSGVVHAQRHRVQPEGSAADHRGDHLLRHRLTACASAANKYVLNQIRQSSLAVSTQTEYAEVWGPGQSKIVLRRRPVVGIAVVTVERSALASTKYRYDAEYGF